MYNQRIKLFLCLIALVFAGIIARLWHLQVKLGDRYRVQITQRMRLDDVLPASRGHILDRQGAILACDEPCFDLCLDYRLVFLWTNEDPNHPFTKVLARWRRYKEAEIVGTKNPPGDPNARQQLRNQAREIFDQRLARTRRLAMEQVGSNSQLAQVLRRIYDRVEGLREASAHKSPQEQFQSHPIVKGLDDAAALGIKSQLDGMVGVQVRPGYRRKYPYGHLACHVIGYTGKVSPDEPNRYNLGPERADDLVRRLINYDSEDFIGKSGVERMCEGFPTEPLEGPDYLNTSSLEDMDRLLGLRGRRGLRKRNRLSGEVVEELPAVQGRDVHLTLDIGLQDRLTTLFPPGATGAIVVLSVPRGEVLAMVSLPTYDLNRFRQDYTSLASDEVFLPLRHRAVSQLYPPGSTAKPVVALSALSSGLIDTNYTRDCTGYLLPSVRDHWRCWTVERGMPGHGPMNVTDALKNSCNVFFYHVGEIMGGRRLMEGFGQFGFTELPGTGLPEERRGLVATNPSVDDCRQMGIGQGPIAITPLHVANAMAAVARGEYRSAVLVIDGGKEQEIRPLPQTAAHFKDVREGMFKVANDPGGTAYKVFHGEGIQPLGIQVCGKTGTADVQAHKVSGKQAREGNMAWFAGFAPYDRPQIAVTVVLEYIEGGGAANAGPIAREAFRACIERGYIQRE